MFDADAEVHKLYGPGGAAVAPIEAAFPGLDGADGVDRQKLGAHAAGEPDGFRQLERIVHPLVRDAERAFLAEEVAKGAEMAVLEIPLLFEGKGYTQVRRDSGGERAGRNAAGAGSGTSPA